VGIVPRRVPGNGKGQRGATMTELPKMPVEKLSQHLREALSQEQPSPPPCLWCLYHCTASAGSLPPPMGDEYHGPDIYSRASGGLRLLPASELAGGSLLLGIGGQPSGSALVRPPIGALGLGGPSTCRSACYTRRNDKDLLSGGPGQGTAGRLATASLRRRATASL
jgi:hypothetical protein